MDQAIASLRDRITVDEAPLQDLLEARNRKQMARFPEARELLGEVSVS